MAPKLNLERRLLAKLESPTEKRKRGGAEPSTAKDKAEVILAPPPKRVKASAKAGKGLALTETSSEVSEATPSMSTREEEVPIAENRPLGWMTSFSSAPASSTREEAIPLSGVQPEPSSGLTTWASSLSLPVRAEDTLEQGSVTTAYRANMFSERDLRALGQMKADKQDFLSAVSSHLLKSLLELRGLGEVQQEEREATVLWRNKASKEKDERQRAKYAAGQMFRDMEDMKAELQKMSEKLKDQHTLFEQAADKYDRVRDALATV